MSGELARLRADNKRLLGELDRRDAVLDWLRENTPRVLDLCPYNLGGESVSREARAMEQREPDGGAASRSCSPPMLYFGAGDRCQCGESPTSWRDLGDTAA